MSIEKIKYRNGIIYVDETLKIFEKYLHLSIDGRHQIYDLKGNEAEFEKGKFIGWTLPIIGQSIELNIKNIPHIKNN